MGTFDCPSLIVHRMIFVRIVCLLLFFPVYGIFIMFVNVVKGMEETKFSKVFVYYIIQTSNLSEYFTRIKSIIISKNE